MSVIKGVMGYTRCCLQWDAPLLPDQIAVKLNLFRFRPLHPQGEDNVTSGFAPYRHEFDDERGILLVDCLFDQTIVLALRTDTITIPKDRLKAMVKKSLVRYQSDFNKIPDRLAKKEIEHAHIKELRARMLPKTNIVECAWCLKTGELRIFSRSKSVVDRFIELFKQTFLLTPIPRDFACETSRHAHALGFVEVLETLTHEPIFTPVARVDVQ